MAQQGVHKATLTAALILAAILDCTFTAAFCIGYNVEQHRLPQNVMVVGLASRVPTTSSRLTMSLDGSDSYSLSPRQYISIGMERFRQANVQGSIDAFDAAARLMGENSRPYLWQRGISYYYVDNYVAGSQQFRDDVLQSPLDVEEIVWDIACLTRIDPSIFPPPNKLSLPRGKTDRRPIMAIVYNLFRGEAKEQELADFGHQGSPGEEFYSLFYLGLYNDARGDMTKAEHYM